MSGSIVITLPVLLVGGTEMQTMLQVRALVCSGHRVTLCCFYQYDEIMHRKMKDAGAEVLLLDLDRREGLRVLLQRLVREFRRVKPDIVHVQYMAPGFIPVLAARLAGVPRVFATVHQPGRPYGWKAHLLLRTAARLCTRFFCNSLAVERSWFGNASLYGPGLPITGKRGTLYNAVDCRRVAQAADSAREGHAGFVIGCVGRLRREKGQDILVQSAVKILNRHPEVRFHMIGDGPDREMLCNLTREAGVADRFSWLGACAPEEVYRSYGGMDLLVVPSRFEGFGLVAVEGMAAGLPVVASKVDGLEEVVADGETGILVIAGDVEDLANACCRIIDDRKHAVEMGALGKKRANECFSFDRYALLTQELHRI